MPDMNQDGQGDEKFQELMRARERRIKEKDDQITHGLMIKIDEPMKDGLQFKNEGLEDDGNPHKLLIVQCLHLQQTMEQIGIGRNPREESIFNMDPRGPYNRKGLLEDGKYSSLIEGSSLHFKPFVNLPRTLPLIGLDLLQQHRAII
ncbi:hypothetical protein M9H77_16752 [Catharanthus roseus]|uniref:Uncharacterized protein n=1 Tax=Catharanthus roseus TaxID=4058 RepID=A0ACC0B2N4_CATRO|nr:hypothetical protein M9H77_16752 [Catharanthus roseus]